MIGTTVLNSVLKRSTCPSTGKVNHGERFIVHALSYSGCSQSSNERNAEKVQRDKRTDWTGAKKGKHFLRVGAYYRCRTMQRENVAEVNGATSIIQLVIRKPRSRRALWALWWSLWGLMAHTPRSRGQRVLCSNFVPNKTNSFKGAGASGIRPPC